MKTLSIVCSLVILAGCATAPVEQVTLAPLTPPPVPLAPAPVPMLGMTQRDAVALLGSPHDIVSNRMDGAMVDTWMYLDKTLTFENGILHSWSMTARSGAAQTQGHAP